MANAVITDQPQKASLLKEIIRNRSSYLFISGFMAVFIVFTIIPVGIAVFLGFTHFNVLEPARFIGLDNYKNLFLRDSVFLIAVKNTFIFAAITGPVSYLMSLFLAWLINEIPRYPRAFMTLLCYAPSISGGAYFVWTIIFSSDARGYLNAFLYNAGLINRPIQWLADPRYMMSVSVFVILWLSLGTSFLAFIAGLQGVDRSLYEAAAVDGVKNRYQELWFITLPMIKPQLLFGAVMSITASFNVGDTITALVGYPSTDYAVHTVVHHMQDYGNIRFQMGYACAIATLLFAAMVGINKIVQSLLRKVGT
ncbi:MAG: carbohydrate ABC transporter permease [Saccharofermentanales bacterium]